MSAPNSYGYRTINVMNTVLFICTIAFSGPIYASKNLSLDQAFKLTLEKNPQLYQFNFNEVILNAQKELSELSPAIELSTEIENIAGTGDTKGVDAAETTVALSSIVELGGKKKARVSLAQSRLDQLSWERQALTLDVLGELTTSFVDGLQIQANVALAQDALAISQSLLSTVKSKAAKGALPDAEVMRAKAALVNAEILLAKRKSQFRQQKVLLAQFWGDTEADFDGLSGDLFRYETTESFEQLFDRVKASPSLQVFASKARVQEANILLAKAKGRSDLNWQVGVRRLEELDDTAFIVGFSVPLFARKRNKSNVESAIAQQNLALSDSRIELLRLRAELFQAYSLRNQSIEAVQKIRETAIPALESALNLTRQAYENGRYRYLDLVAAQEELLATKQALIDTAATALISQAVIEKLTGQSMKP